MDDTYKAYFDSASSDDTATSTSNENEESKQLFTGSMDNIDTWVKFHKLIIEKDNQKSERDLRESNAKKAFWFSAVWAVFIAIFILLHAFKTVDYFKITETEFLFVCGTLTSSVLIFYLTVIKNLFPRVNGNNKPKQN